MARERIGDDLMQVRFPDGTFERIDGVSGNRSDFIRRAVEVALCAAVDGDAPASLRKKVKKKKKPDPAVEAVREAVAAISPKPSAPRPPVARSGRDDDIAALLATAGQGRYSSRYLRAKMGWLGLRYDNAERAVLSSGKAWFVNGVMVTNG